MQRLVSLLTTLTILIIIAACSDDRQTSAPTPAKEKKAGPSERLGGIKDHMSNR